ncbi:MAG: PAS domain S-box protein [Polaribacter sp.]|uniref:PAS domain S-box protein n=1 Tax=Polaribacter sp. TaxID=1920175 RepID=UPI0026045FFC|nr:PAS domain S-box protein [uncultured Polaribacter sp.]
MDSNKVEILERALKREKAARKAAEKILEEKSRDLYLLSEELKTLLNEKSFLLKGLFDTINDAYLVIDLKGNILEMNKVAFKVINSDLKKEKINIKDLVYKDDIDYVEDFFKTLHKEGSTDAYTLRILTKSKEIMWLQVKGTLLFNNENKPIAAQAIIRDITKEKKASDLLVESENRLSSIIMNLDKAVLLEDENRKIVLTNQKFCDLFNIPVSPNLMIGQDCSNAAEQSKELFKKPEDFVNKLSEILQKKEKVLADELVMKNGTILERDFIPIVSDMKYKGHLWTYKDVTLKKQYNKSLETQKEKYSNIIANMNLGLMEVNNQDEILMINHSFAKMSGYSEKELIGKKGIEVFLDFVDAETLHKESLKRIKGKSNSYELKVKNKKGDIKHWLVSGAPNYNLKGETIGSIGIHLDITPLKTLQFQKENILKELEQKNKDLNEYAHIVSHDLKSPLRSIDALVSWIKMDNADMFDDVTLQNFNLISKTLETMEKIISDVLEYSSAGANTSKQEIVNLNKTLNNLKKVLFIPENISLNVLTKLPVIVGDDIKFQQLFQNLIGNAIKFSDKEKGIVEIDCVEKSTYYQFSIKDNGMGIEKKYHDKIFKAFHSLNKSEDSSGIGLSIVRKIIDLYKGKIWLESEPNVGTTFYFTLKK